MKRAFILGVVLLFVVLLLSGCSLSSTKGNDSNSRMKKYYTGTEGVVSSFEGMPSRVYYSSEDSEHTFDFGVRVHNKGTSLAKGAIFISGYDPDFISIDGININPDDGNWKDCSIDVTSIGANFGDFGGIISCLFSDGSSFDIDIANSHIVGVNLNKLGSLLEMIGLINHSTAFLDSLNLKFNTDSSGLLNFDVGFNAGDFNINLYYHGTGLIASLMSIVNFSMGYGRDYLLAADDYNYPGGGQEYFNFHAKINHWPQGMDQVPLTFLLTNCYGYVTYASPMVCIDPKPYSEQNKVCHPHPISLSSQGAPVAITKVVPEIGSHKAVFTITVKNVGSGRVINPGYIERCSPYYNADLTQKELNTIYIPENFIRIGDHSLKCSPKGYVRLNDRKEAQITCTYDLRYSNLQTAYTTPLIIELWYGYQEIHKKNVLFKKI